MLRALSIIACCVLVLYSVWWYFKVCIYYIYARCRLARCWPHKQQLITSRTSLSVCLVSSWQRLYVQVRSATAVSCGISVMSSKTFSTYGCFIVIYSIYVILIPSPTAVLPLLLYGLHFKTSGTNDNDDLALHCRAVSYYCNINIRMVHMYYLYIISCNDIVHTSHFKLFYTWIIIVSRSLRSRDREKRGRRSCARQNAKHNTTTTTNEQQRVPAEKI